MMATTGSASKWRWFSGPVLAAGAVLTTVWCGAPAWTQETQEAKADQILETARSYVDQYLAGLPNFICEETTEQFEADKKKNRWTKKNTLVSRLVFDGQREKLSLELVNGKPPKTANWQAAHRRLTTEGEFAVLLSNIFSDSSHTTFHWKAWEDWKGRRLAVFNYSISQEHSTIKLRLSDLSQAVLPYHGSLYVDPENGAVWRITDELDEIPPSLKTRAFSTWVEYSPVNLGGTNYLLPETASVQTESESGSIRHDLAFKNYRKFEAQSTITFGEEGAQTATPKPKSGPPEKPPI